MWWLLAVSAVILAAIVWRSRRRSIAAWAHLERLIDDVANARMPATFLVDGNEHARRAALKLEQIFLRQRGLDQRASEGELDIRTILAAMPDGLCVVDQNARVRLLNPAIRRIFGIDDASPTSTLIETCRDTNVVRTIENALRDRTSTREMLKLRASTAGTRDIAVTTLPIKSETDDGGGAVVLFEDVTQLQQLEEVRRDFVSNVSHELRTPLSIFRGYLETLLDEPELGADERERILRVLEKHSTRLNSLVDDLLSLARLEAPEPHLEFGELDVRTFVDRVAKEWDKKLSARQLRIVAEVPNELPSISADQARMEEVLYNLVDNAQKYSREGGTITITAARVDEHHVAIGVSDEGTGIAATDLPRIFERFYRADKARSREVGGTGLGLSIVKHIVQLHGGSVQAESRLGKGTTMRAILPIARSPAV